MSLTGLMTHSITTYRLTAGSGMQSVYTANLSGQNCLIQPLSAEYAARVNMVFGRSYNCFLPIGTDLLVSDKVVDQDGKEYRVNGMLRRNYGMNQHLTALLTEQITANPDQ